MVLPMPDLDTGRFPDLADEARATIPRAAPAWTDHNLSDPGITMTELLAAEVDRLMYRVNRITDRDRRTLLRLIGFAPHPPQAARGFVAFRLGTGAPRMLPAGLALIARDLKGGPVSLALRDEVRVGSAALVAVMIGAATTPRDVTALLAAGGPVDALGDDPSPGSSSALYIGFDVSPDTGPLDLAFAIADDDGSRRLPGGTATDDATMQWEWFDGAAWHPVAVADDGTESLSCSGRTRLSIAGPIPLAPLPPRTTPLAWMRCRLASGRPDEPPQLTGIAVHAGAVEQCSAIVSRLVLSPGYVPPPGREPVAGTSAPLAFLTDQLGAVTAMAAGAPLTTADVEVFESTASAVLASVVPVGWGDRTPNQVLWLPNAPLVASSVTAWVVRQTPGGLETEPIPLLPDLDAGRPHDTVAVLDPALGTLTVGDGRCGRMLAPDEFLLASYESTLGAAGSLRAASPLSIDPRPDGANNALLGESSGLVADRITPSIPWAIAGGADAEDIEHAAGRAARRLSVHERLLELVAPDGPSTLDGVDPAVVRAAEVPERALTAVDLERIVLATPGRHVARCRAFPGLEPTLPGWRAAGTATVVVIPFLPKDRPQPTEALLDAVRTIVVQRRIVGSRIVCTGPTYVEVSIRATLDLSVAADVDATLAAARDAVDAFLHPLTGGPSGRGWPFGRDVYRADILAVLDGVEGVDSVAALELVDAGGNAACGNLCVPPTALVDATSHDIRSSST